MVFVPGAVRTAAQLRLMLGIGLYVDGAAAAFLVVGLVRDGATVAMVGFAVFLVALLGCVAGFWWWARPRPTGAGDRLTPAWSALTTVSFALWLGASACLPARQDDAVAALLASWAVLTAARGTLGLALRRRSSAARPPARSAARRRAATR